MTIYKIVEILSLLYLVGLDLSATPPWLRVLALKA